MNAPMPVMSSAKVRLSPSIRKLSRRSSAGTQSSGELDLRWPAADVR